ncbi:MAG: hypothetical protein E6R13_04070 [Spirochaetes bacterium]|nr:MAG: hypothetical protein E6R13_04070 [Spirochaetota bacterium]
MITYSTIHATNEFKNRLIQNNVRLGALAGTELALMVNNSHTPIMEGTLFDNWREEFLDAKAQPNNPVMLADASTDFLYKIADSLNKPTTNDCDVHCDYMKPIVQRMAELLRFNHHLARNVVTPIAKAVFDKVTDLQKQRIAKYASVLSVVPSHYEKIWSSIALNDMVENYKDSPIYDEAVFPSIHPLQTGEQLVEIMKTGVGRFDKEIDDFVKEVSVELVEDVYRNYFAVGSSTGAPYDYEMRVNWLTNYSMSQRREVLIAFLLAKGLKRKVLENIELPLDEYENTMSKAIEQTGRGICRVFELRETYRRQKRLVLRWPSEGSEYQVAYGRDATIEVNEDIYNEWLVAGGKVEMLFGSFITDKRDTPDGIMEKGPEYERAWAKRAAMIRSAQRSDAYSFTVAAIKDAMTEQINQLDENFLISGVREPIHNALLDYLENNINLNCVEQLYECIRNMVCDVMFPLSDAKFLLTSIARISTESPDLDVNEAALLASLELVAKSISSMMVVNPK